MVRPISDRALWWTLVVLISVWGAAYALGSPPESGVDEIMHTIKSTTISHGEILGEPHPQSLEVEPIYGPENALFQMPLFLGDGSAECFRTKPSVVPTCAEFAGDTSFQPSFQPDNRYQPFYYLAVGVPGRLKEPGAGSVWLMRLVSVVLTAMFVASGFLSARRFPNPTIGVVAYLVAITPTVISVSATLNPSGLEIATAVACWATALAIAWQARAHATTAATDADTTDADTGGPAPTATPSGSGAWAVDRRLARRLAVSATLMAVVRPASPVFLAAILASAAFAAGWRPALALVKQRPIQLAAAAVAAGVLFTMAWNVVVHPILVGAPVPAEWDAWDVLRFDTGRAPWLYRQMIGTFGAPDYEVPEPVVVVWTMLLGGLVFSALATARTKMVLGAGALIAGTIALPIFMDFRSAHTLGAPWQGRYTLPLAIGVPLFLGLAIAESRHARTTGRTLSASRASTDTNPWQSRQLRIGIAVLVAVAQVVCLWQFLRRYAVGENGPLWFWTATQWSTPVANVLLLLAGVAAIVGYALVAVVAAEPAALAGIDPSVTTGNDVTGTGDHPEVGTSGTTTTA